MQRDERITGQRAQPAPASRPGRGWARRGLVALSAPMVLFLLLPLLALILRVDPGSIAAHLVGREVAAAIRLSLATTAATLALTVVAGTPVAYIVARWRFRGRMLLDTLLDLPMVLPPSVAGIALLIAFGRRGLVGRYLDDLGINLAFTSLAVVLAQTFVAAPFYIKAAIAGFAGADRELEQAAALDGAGPRQVFWLITLPLCWPALLGGAIMAWARALGEFGATIIFAGNFPGRTQTMPLAIYLGFELDFEVALTLSLVLLVCSFAVIFLVKRLLRQRISASPLGGE